MLTIENPQVVTLIHAYPIAVRKKLLFLRQLIIETASEISEIKKLEETLKWGEPAYITSIGSTLRIDWKPSKPTQYAMYFHCKTKLLDTFKELYHDTFMYEGNRAIIFSMNDNIPIAQLKHCIALSLIYKTVKHLPMLGA